MVAALSKLLGFWRAALKDALVLVTSFLVSGSP